MSNKNKFQPGEIVNLGETGEEVTIMKFQYVPKMKKYTYVIKEKPSTFYFEEELTKI
ncbi:MULTISPECIES: hypothetical protein [Bacillaceae]|uniref:DUF2187 domain-containing protein n=1 Tax=Peribacillus huizhouensis TaxID=1501239 RepID=A0ABR6CRS5_9BACI|nr:MULTISPECIES: hypothetical protein [Bacillaceae]MBA9027730.1 hypothetical protein [Peribacillus huizhouensis]